MAAIPLKVSNGVWAGNFDTEKPSPNIHEQKMILYIRGRSAELKKQFGNSDQYQKKLITGALSELEFLEKNLSNILLSINNAT